MRVFSRLPVPRRLATIGLGFVPIAVMIYLIAARITGDATFSQLELYGNEYQRPLEDLLEHIPLYGRLAARAAAGDRSGRADLLAAQQRVDAAFAKLQAVQMRLGATLQFTDDALAQRKRDHVKVATVEQEWRALASSIDTATPAAIAGAEAHLVADVRMMISHAGDTSNLILDPDLDTYYTMDATLLALPQTQDRLAALVSLGERLLGQQTLTAEERIQLAVAAAALKESDLDRVSADVQTALNEDGNFLGTSESLQRNLPPALAAYAAATRTFIDLTNRIVAAPTPTVRPEAFVNAGLNARQASFTLWTIAAGELDTLIQRRVDHHKQARLMALMLGGLAAALSGALLFLVARSITGQLGETSEALAVSASQLHTAAERIAETSDSLSQGASEQATALECTSTAMTQLSSATKRNAGNSRQAAQLMHDVDACVAGSAASLAAMVGSMDLIRKSSGRISTIIRTIDEIAFQTNVLALNAAVEAARARTAGLGFAVVADEVRNLAQRAAAAARDTAALIEESIGRTNEGSRNVVDVSASISSITETVARTRVLMDQVSGASSQQASSIDEVVSALQRLARVTDRTQQTAAQVSESSAELAAHAAQEMRVVGDLRALVVGTRPPQASDEAQPTSAGQSETQSSDAEAA